MALPSLLPAEGEAAGSITAFVASRNGFSERFDVMGTHQMLSMQMPLVQALHRRIISLAHPAPYSDSLLHSAPSDTALLANLYPR